MKFITVDTYKKLSRQAANIISAQVILKPDSVLGLATGSVAFRPITPEIPASILQLHPDITVIYSEK